MTVTNDIKYIGVNDHEIDLFEGQYKVPNGMSYYQGSDDGQFHLCGRPGNDGGRYQEV